jgi:hypothetical protein
VSDSYYGEITDSLGLGFLFDFGHCYSKKERITFVNSFIDSSLNSCPIRKTETILGTTRRRLFNTGNWLQMSWRTNERKREVMLQG